MNIKRIFTLLLSLLMLLLSSINNVYAENEILQNPITTQEYYALRGMGFVGEELDSRNADDNITRAEFTGYLCKLAGYNVTERSMENIPFIDVSTVTPYYNEICTMYEMGIISGTEPQIFSPNAGITYAQASKMIIEVLGYTLFSEIKYGGYPMGPVHTVAYLDICDGVKNTNHDSELNADDAIMMLYNSAMSTVMVFEGVNSKGDSEYTDFGVNLIRKAHDIYTGKGVVKAIGAVSLDEKSVSGNYTVIGTEKYESSDTDFSDLLGCQVNYFYKDHNDSKKILWISGNDYYNDILELSAKDLVTDDDSFSTRNIVYYSDAKRKVTVTVDPKSVVYNNTLIPVPQADDFKIQTGYIRLIDSDRDNSYETVIIKEHKNVFVDKISVNTSHVVDKYGNTIDLKLYDDVVILKDNKEAGIEDILPDTVISYYENRDKDKLEIHIVQTRAEGVLKTINKYKYTLDDGSEYRLSATYQTPVGYYRVDPSIGSKYVYYLDISGEIAAIADSGDMLQYALLMNAVRISDFDGEYVKTRLLMSDGSKVDGRTQKKVVIGGQTAVFAPYEVSRKPAEKIFDYVTEGNVEPQVVKVMFDNEGYLKEIHFAKYSRDGQEVDGNKKEEVLDRLDQYLYYDDETFSLDSNIGLRLRYTDGYYLMGNQYMPRENAIVFAKWSGMDESEPYTVEDRTVLQSGDTNKEYKLKLYDIGNDMTVPVVYMEGFFDAESRWLGNFMIVEDTDIVYEDGAELRRIKGYVSGMYRTLTEYDEGVIPQDIDKGDVIRVSVYNDKVTKVVVLLDKSAGDYETKKGQELVFATNSILPQDTQSVRYVPIYNVTNMGLVTINPIDWYTNKGYPKLNTAGFRQANKTIVTIYDLKNDYIYAGDHHDIYQLYPPRADGTLPDESDLTMAVIRTRNTAVYEILLVLN